MAEKTGAPYDTPGVKLTHDGKLCRFDAFLKKYGLNNPALQKMVVIMRGANTSKLDLATKSAGLYALSQTFAGDHEM